MTVRMARISLVLGVALFYVFVVFNNLSDCNSNYQFIRHVLMMDSTFPNFAATTGCSDRDRAEFGRNSIA